MVNKVRNKLEFPKIKQKKNLKDQNGYDKQKFKTKLGFEFNWVLKSLYNYNYILLLIIIIIKCTVHEISNKSCLLFNF